MNTTALGERVSVLRLAADLSQVQLAERIGLSNNSMVSKIENGRLPTIDEGLVQELARSLDCSAAFLLRPPHDVLATRPWLRAYADARARTVDSVVAENRLHHELITTLNLKRVPVQRPEFDSLADPDDDAVIESFALEARAAAGISEGAVVKNAIRAAERLGAIVLPLSSEVGQRHLGLSQFVDGVPYIRVSRAQTPSGGVPGDRQRFTVAHEIGHVLVHEQVAAPETTEGSRHLERQAHRFAGAFLTPADSLLDDLDQLGGRVTLTTLQRLKSTWGVAIKMLVVRLRQLGVISSDQSISLYKQISKRGWNTVEPVPVTNEKSIWFERALEQEFPGQSSSAPAREVGLGESFILRWTDWDGHDVSPAPVVSLDDRRSLGSGGVKAAPGQVTRLPRR